MSFPPSDFAATFRRHAIPRIRAMIEVRGYFVGVGCYDLANAHADIMAYACRLGASLLPPAHLDALIDWTLTTLAEAAEARHG